VKEMMEALATYKMKVDESVLAIVEKLGEDKLLAPTGAYFPTIYDQLKHLFGSGVNWIKRLKPAFPKSAALSASRFADFDLQTLKAPFGEVRTRLFADIRQIDRETLAFVRELDDASLAAAFTYKNYKGELETHALWQVLLHWFNHDTHHRGAISCQMDSLGIENDFSSLINKI
jgi:uncharacterized damage-inducible protein DinB